MSLIRLAVNVNDRPTASYWNATSIVSDVVNPGRNQNRERVQIHSHHLLRRHFRYRSWHPQPLAVSVLVEALGAATRAAGAVPPSRTMQMTNAVFEGARRLRGLGQS